MREADRTQEKVEDASVPSPPSPVASRACTSRTPKPVSATVMDPTGPNTEASHHADPAKPLTVATSARDIDVPRWTVPPPKPGSTLEGGPVKRKHCPTCRRVIGQQKPPRDVLDDPVDRVARRVVRLLERSPRGLLRGDLRRELGSHDRGLLDAAADYAAAREWFVIEEVMSPVTGRVFARRYLLGPVVPKEPGRRRRRRLRPQLRYDDGSTC